MGNMNGTLFTDDQVLAMLAFLQDKREAGYTLEEVIGEIETLGTDSTFGTDQSVSHFRL